MFEIGSARMRSRFIVLSMVVALLAGAFVLGSAGPGRREASAVVTATPSCPDPTAETVPCIITKKMSPRGVVGDGAPHIVAQLPLPAGAFTIFAKAEAVGPTYSGDTVYGLSVHCRLRAGNDFDDSRLAPVEAGTNPFPDAILTFNVSHVFPAAGAAVLTCDWTPPSSAKGTFGPWMFRNLRLTAVKAGALTNGPNNSANTCPPLNIETTPCILSAYADAAAVPGDGSWRTLLTLRIPVRGSYTVFGKGVFTTAYDAGDDIECRLSSGSDYDKAITGSATPATKPLSLNVSHRYSGPSAAAIMCRSIHGAGSVNPHPWSASWLKITAIKAGYLLNGPTQVGASCPMEYPGTVPCIKTGYFDGPINLGATPTLVGSLPLDPGTYTIFAKLYATRTRAYTQVNCSLATPEDADGAHVVTWRDFDYHYPMALNVTANLPQDGSVQLRCDYDGTNTSAAANFVKITAIRAGTLRTIG